MVAQGRPESTWQQLITENFISQFWPYIITSIRRLKQIKVWRERFTFIPERGFIFARVKTGQVGTWSLVE